MTFLHTTMSAVQGFLAHSTTAWDGIQTRCPDFAFHDCLDGLAATRARLDDLRSSRALAWFVILWVTRVSARMVSARKRPVAGLVALIESKLLYSID